MKRSWLVACALLGAAACASRAPRIALPIEVRANCENRAVKQTAIDSIVASTDDHVRSAAYPGDRALKKLVASGGGAFASWRDQPLLLPQTAKTIGVSGDYVVLKRAVITNQVDPASHGRAVWFTFASPKGDVVVMERAFDVQDVCIEGQRDI